MPGSARRRTLAIALVVGLLGGLLPQPAAAAAPGLSTSTVASGLSIPWDVAFLPDGRMLVTERAGRIRIYASGTPGAALLQTVTVPSVRALGEAGLMGIAVDHDFALNGYVYVCASRQYTGSGGWVNQVLRYSVRSDGSWAALTVLVGGMRAASIHNGCAVETDRFGRVWASMGDAAIPSLAQNRSSLNGKILRMNREGGTPSDNPVINGTRNIVYSMGHRNPQGIAIRPGTDQVYAVEHGPDRDDEINLLEPGANYGWPCYTGAGNPYDDLGGSCGPAGNYDNPLWASGIPTLATSGGAFVGGGQWQDYEGDLFVPTLKESDLRRFTPNDAGTALAGPSTHFNGTWGRLRGATLGPGGQLYLTTSNGSGDRVIRVRAATPQVARIAGSDRYATAASLSQAAFPGGAGAVMVATGADFPDALAGSAAAGSLGIPVLLTDRWSVPPATRAELRRLDPNRIWVLGGSGVISARVKNALEAYASVGVQRIAGADRYETAALIADRWFSPGVPHAFVAVGTTFADALAGAPAAGMRDAPLLLVASNEIPAPTRRALRDLAPGRIWVLGGPAVISGSVVNRLKDFTSGSVKRLAGRDRFATAEAIIRQFWGKETRAYVASGVSFPDALAGGAVAGKQGVPMLLSSTFDVSLHTGQQALRLSPNRVTMLGGTAALSSGVQARLQRLLGIP